MTAIIWDNTNQTFPIFYSDVNETTKKLAGYVEVCGVINPILWSLQFDDVLVIGDAEQGKMLCDAFCLENRSIRFLQKNELLEYARDNFANDDLFLVPSVWTSETEFVRSELSKFANSVNSDNIGKSGRIFSLNTRLGAKNFLTSISIVKDHIAPSFVCHSCRELEHEMLRLSHVPLVAKPNFSMGGMGFVTQRSFGESVKNDEKIGIKRYHWQTDGQPYLVERMIGISTSNTSITVDIHVGDVVTNLVEMSEQILSEDFIYNGVKNIGADFPAMTKEKIFELSIMVGNSLRQIGVKGYANIDFCVTDDLRIVLCDLNIRRSAPLGLHLLLKNMSLSLDKDDFPYSSFSILTDINLEFKEINQLFQKSKYAFNGNSGIMPVDIRSIEKNSHMVDFFSFGLNQDVSMEACKEVLFV